MTKKFQSYKNRLTVLEICSPANGYRTTYKDALDLIKELLEKLYGNNHS